MESNMSLVLFTLLGQAVAGMLLSAALFFPRANSEGGKRLGWMAVIMLGAGALISLSHLSDPLLSFYSITNLGTSWLSREILFLGILGLPLLGWAILGHRILLYIAVFGGLGLVYVMSRIYSLPTVAFWDSSLTLAYFAATMLLLGSVTFLAFAVLASTKRPGVVREVLMGPLMPLAALSFVFRMAVAVLQAMHAAGTPVISELLTAHAVLTPLGAGLGLLMAMRGLAGIPPMDTACDAPPRMSAPGVFLLFASGLIWAGEVCGRMAFYSGLATFGM